LALAGVNGVWIGQTAQGERPAAPPPRPCMFVYGIWHIVRPRICILGVIMEMEEAARLSLVLAGRWAVWH